MSYTEYIALDSLLGCGSLWWSTEHGGDISPDSGGYFVVPVKGVVP